MTSWLIVNNSSPVGTTSWFQGEPVVFSAYNGSANSYIAANFNSAGPGGNTSTWLISPAFSVLSAMRLSFYTRAEASPALAADLLEVRLSTNGASSDVGTTATSVGDFTNLLLTVNSTLSLTGYPGAWTNYTAALGVPAGTTARLAFRYAVPDTNTNGNYIGLDNVQVASTPEPATWSLVGLAALAFALRRRRA